ncbi:hypothetical protein SAMN04490248_11329 [Salinihabitans flavidus]|uniref:YgjP-like metallopeptidase domain-containing protein n=1 Tax=Salinihabitans flavidus TaxID=569882 RepID=A0A1H8ST69_9RHOB|nr:SprT family zinc-dependent metalloprotease [Salinihabitans flavidus]SEO81787.1 hypothetical protein SAMN04490248_11329 [Salinihabitans flavidus]
MGQHLLPGNPEISLDLRRSARARRISLRVSRIDGRVTLTLPRGVPEAEGLQFARDRADWLRRHLSDRPAQITAAIGAQIPVQGEFRRIETEPGRAVQLQPGAITVPGDPARAGARIAGFLKTRARAALVPACDAYAARLGRPYTRITLRDTRSRWGSCSSAGALMFSWRLIMAPPEVLDYVAAHEVAHLTEMNHSPAFWSTVERLYGDYAAPRAWLRQQGDSLHLVRF